MDEFKYFVEIGGYRVAENMSIKIALTLVKALFAEYYDDKRILISIRRMDWDKSNGEGT